LTKLAIIVGSTRANRFADRPARWIHDHAAARGDAEVETLDLRDYPMPFFDEPVSPVQVSPRHPVAQRWQQKIAAADGYIVIAAEYNRGPTAVLKNALDHAYKEFNNKPVAFVGYGGVGGARAIEQLRLIAVELQMAPIRVGVHIVGPVFVQVLKEGKALSEFDALNQQARVMLDQLMWWVDALKAARDKAR